MKLLIVDDEELTREGLLSSIIWEELGITELFQADDGVHGLSCALKNKPELILCDVRMPRMDGIRMVENIQERLPDTVVIFMSGYSDKEYLKAAIKLKAVNYVEKPLNIEEIKEAVLDGIESYQQKQRSLNSQAWQYLENYSKLAMQLTFPYSANRELIKQLCDILSLNDAEHSYYTSFLAEIIGNHHLSNEDYRVISSNMEQFLKSYPLSFLIVEKHQKYIVFFIYGKAPATAASLSEITAFLQHQLINSGNYFLCQGRTVQGIAQAYHSYESAVILMQNSFFFDNNTLLTADESMPNPKRKSISDVFSQDFFTDFSDSLLAKEKDKALKLLAVLYDFFYKNTAVLPDQAKDIYYKLFTALQDVQRRMKFTEKNNLISENETIIHYLEQFYFFKDLHESLLTKVEYYFSAVDNQNNEHPTVFMIKEYIAHHYKQENLSVKDISEHVYLSASYVCTLFKAETGKTLNQYITEYRMEKAKKLLRDPRYKITDISDQVGYSDGNYFGKSFKKAVGLSPSEYREKMVT